MCVGLASQLIDALLLLPQFEQVGYVRLHSSDSRIEATIARVADVPVALARDALQKFGGADAAVAALLDGWRPQIGKRAENDQRSNETVDSHQMQRRLARDDARRQAEEEREIASRLADLTVRGDDANERGESSVKPTTGDMDQYADIDDDVPLEGGVSHYIARDDHESLDIDFPPLSYNNGGGGLNKGAASSRTPRGAPQTGIWQTA
ncbi:hypothetical protein FGB62_171g015 [Gracilaria domingensis]|nr:hypothetical protein FGB62_171g015 [Gracilaria domingensis]